MNNIKISIVVPVYNDEKYLGDCLKSLINQTYKNIEIVCVNDGATDGSMALLQKARAEDDRIIIIDEHINQGTSKARKDGVSITNGDYILFVDADDKLNIKACEELVKIVEEIQTDIIHFGMEVVPNADDFKEKAGMLTSFFSPEEGLYDIRIIRDKSFIDGTLSHNLCGKMIDGNLCRDVFSKLSDRRMIMGEDLYAYFAIIINANSYYGYRKNLYVYNYGIGIMEDMDLYKSFVNYCSQSIVGNECMKLAEAYGKEAEQYACQISINLRRSVVQFLLRNSYKFKINDEFIRILKEYWTEDDIICMLFELAETENTYEKILKSKVWKFPYNKIKKGAKIVLYAAGDMGCDYYQQIIDSKYCDMIAWIDKTGKSKRKVDNKMIRIMTPDYLKECEFEYIVIAVSNTRLQEQIKIELISKYKISEEKIILPEI